MSGDVRIGRKAIIIDNINTNRKKGLENFWKMLGTVQMCGETLSHLESEDICTFLKSNTLRALSLRDCKIEENDFIHLVNCAGKCKTILQLNLNLGLVCNLERAQALSASLQRNRSLTSLLLHGSPLGEKGTAVLCRGLSLHPNIVCLDVGDCLLSDNSVAAVASLLPSNGAKKGLKELTLSANPAITTQGWTRFFISLSANAVLKTLNLDYNTIGDCGADCLAVTLASNRTLEEVDLEGTGISEVGAQTLLYLVQNFPVNLQSLILSENKIKPETVKLIEEAIDKNDGFTGMSYIKSDKAARASNASDCQLESPGSTMKSELGDPLGGNTNYWSVGGGTQESVSWTTPSQTLHVNDTYMLERISPQMLKTATTKALRKEEKIRADPKKGKTEVSKAEDDEEADDTSESTGDNDSPEAETSVYSVKKFYTAMGTTHKKDPTRDSKNRKTGKKIFEYERKL